MVAEYPAWGRAFAQTLPLSIMFGYEKY